MKIIAVVGTGSGCGKTPVACRILPAIPSLGAVKISPREGASCVERGAGEAGKDTDLCAASGAARTVRIVGPRAAVGATWDLIRGQFESCPGVVVEGASAIGLPGERFFIFIQASLGCEPREERNRVLVKKTDIISDRSSHFSAHSAVSAVQKFLIDPGMDRLRAPVRRRGGAEGRSPSAQRSEYSEEVPALLLRRAIRSRAEQDREPPKQGLPNRLQSEWSSWMDGPQRRDPAA